MVQVIEIENEPVTPWICQISRFSTLFMGREMGRLGFGPGQFFFLAALYENEGLSQDELSVRVGVDKSNTSRALAKLERYGFIRRQPDPDNHRVKKVYLAPKGRAMRPKFIKIQQQWNAALLDGLSPKTKAALLAKLKLMAANAEAFFRQRPETGSRSSCGG